MLTRAQIEAGQADPLLEALANKIEHLPTVQLASVIAVAVQIYEDRFGKSATKVMLATLLRIVDED